MLKLQIWIVFVGSPCCWKLRGTEREVAAAAAAGSWLDVHRLLGASGGGGGSLSASLLLRLAGAVSGNRGRARFGVFNLEKRTLRLGSRAGLDPSLESETDLVHSGQEGRAGWLALASVRVCDRSTLRGRWGEAGYPARFQLLISGLGWGKSLGLSRGQLGMPGCLLPCLQARKLPRVGSPPPPLLCPLLPRLRSSFAVPSVCFSALTGCSRLGQATRATTKAIALLGCPIPFAPPAGWWE